MAVLGEEALVALRGYGYLWVQDGEILKTLLLEPPVPHWELPSRAGVGSAGSWPGSWKPLQSF